MGRNSGGVQGAQGEGKKHHIMNTAKRKSRGGALKEHRARVAANDEFVKIRDSGMGNMLNPEYHGNLAEYKKRGEAYKPSDMQTAISNYTKTVMKTSKTSFTGLNDTHNAGAYSELRRVALNAKFHKNLQAIKDEIKRRKQK